VSDYRLSTFTASDGENLALYDWPLPALPTPRAAVLLVHGLGEHAGRYNPLAQWLTHEGFAVRGYDQYGHGHSNGARGGLSHPTRLLDDLQDMVDATRQRMPAGTPLVLLGHSLGGLVASRLVAEHRVAAIDALVLSSPAFALRLNRLQQALLAVLPRWAPHLSLGNGVQPGYLSHDPNVVRDYRTDSLVHGRISPRLARFVADSGPQVLRAAHRWSCPTLLMYAGQDHLVDASGSQAFAAQASAPHLTVQAFDTLYHELFNERDNAAVFACLKNWLDARFANFAAQTG